MSDRTRKTALITGASAGLGSEFARLFAADGCDVVVVARRVDKLEQLAASIEKEYGVSASAQACDLTESAAPSALAEELERRGLEIEYLVNNAGFGTTGAFAQLDLERELEMVTVNVAALVELTGLFLPGMVARGRGRILNIGSTAGFLAGPFMATYYASKAFVISFSEALYHEVAGTGVTVTVSCPGATATEFSMVAGNDKSRLFKGGGVASSAEVARDAYDAMMRGRRMVVHGARNRFQVQSLRLSPRALAQRIAGRLNRPGREA
jgi:short-subunit dehydrogenase